MRERAYRQQETVCGFAPGLFGVSVEAMARLTDDRIGRALDRLFDADRAGLLIEAVVTLGQRFGVSFDRLHNGSTSIAFCVASYPPTPRLVSAVRHVLAQFGCD